MSVNTTKKNLIEKVSIRTGLTQIDTKIVVDCFIDALCDSLKRHDSVQIRDFGSFKIRERKPREAINPRNMKTVKIKAGFKPVFEPAKNLRERVNESARAVMARHK